MTTKFMFLFRNPTNAPTSQPSPEQMQALYAAWGAWKAKFAKELTPGEGLKPGSAAVVRGSAVTDGPYIETKEVLASYAFVAVDSLAQAIEIAKACPIHQSGGCIEIRELGGW